MAGFGRVGAGRTLQVQVIATAGLGGGSSSFALEVEASLGQLMVAWCLKHQVAPEAVSFMAAGVEFGPDHPLAGLGQGSPDVPVLIQAVPRRPALAPSTARLLDARPERPAPYPRGSRRGAPPQAPLVVDSDTDDELPAYEVRSAFPEDGRFEVGGGEDDEEDVAPIPDVELFGQGRPREGPQIYLPGAHGAEEDEGLEGGEQMLPPSDDEESTDVSLADGEEDDLMSSLLSEGEPDTSGGRDGLPAAAADPADSGSDEGGEVSRVRFRVVAPTEAGENAMVITTSTEMPLGKLMDAWCFHHGLPRSAARFLVQGQEIAAEETPLALGIRSLIPEHLVGVTPLDPGERQRARGKDREVQVLVLPRRRAGAPPLK